MTPSESPPTALGLQPSGTDTYDFENRLIVRTRGDGSTVNLSYDADGNRIAKNILDASGSAASSTGYLVDANNPTGYAQVVEETVNGVLTRVYTYGTGLISESQVSGPSSPATHYYAFDGHGNVRELTDSTGTVTDRYDYDAFGTLIYQSGSTANAHLYCGEAYDADLGLYYLRARYLNPNSDRFWSMDTYQGLNQDPATLHKYIYCSGSPVDQLDPSGRDTLGEIMVAGTIGGTLDSMVTAVSIYRGHENLTVLQVATKISVSFGSGFATGAIGGMFGKMFVRFLGPGINTVAQKAMEGAAGSFSTEFMRAFIGALAGTPITVKSAQRIFVVTIIGAGFGGATAHVEVFDSVTKLPNIWMPWLELSTEQLQPGMVAGAVGAEGAHKALEDWAERSLELNDDEKH